MDITKKRKFSAKERQCAVRHVWENEHIYDTRREACKAISPRFGCAQGTLENWVRQAEFRIQCNFSDWQSYTFGELNIQDENWRKWIERQIYVVFSRLQLRTLALILMDVKYPRAPSADTEPEVDYVAAKYVSRSVSVP